MKKDLQSPPKPHKNPKKLGFYDKLRKGIQGIRTEIVKDTQSFKEDVYAKVTDPKHDETKKQMSDVKNKISKVKVDKEGHTVGIREAKITPAQAHGILKHAGGSDKDYHALTSGHVHILKQQASIYGYKKSKNAPGSKARMFHQHLKRIASGVSEDVMNYGAPARTLPGTGQTRKPSGYGSPARGGDGNGLGASKQEKPPGYGAPAKDLTPGTRAGMRPIKIESAATGKTLRDIIGEEAKGLDSLNMKNARVNPAQKEYLKKVASLKKKK